MSVLVSLRFVNFCHEYGRGGSSPATLFDPPSPSPHPLVVKTWSQSQSLGLIELFLFISKQKRPISWAKFLISVLQLFFQLHAANDSRLYCGHCGIVVP